MSELSDYLEDIINENSELNGFKISDIKFLTQSLFPIHSCILEKENKQIKLAIKAVQSTKMAAAETQGLLELEKAEVVVPHVYHTHKETKFIAMKYIESSKYKNEDLIDNLKKMYHKTCPEFGWKSDNFIGSLVQKNILTTDFEEFWMTCRIENQLKKICDSNLLNYDETKLMEKNISAYIRAQNPGNCKPRLIHGDLWSGNILGDKNGGVFFIDPAISYGNPEQDLAMLCLFGSSLSRSQIDKLIVNIGLSDGFWDRLKFWQIYPLLVHVRIFGRSYLGQLYQAVSGLRAIN